MRSSRIRPGTWIGIAVAVTVSMVAAVTLPRAQQSGQQTPRRPAPPPPQAAARPAAAAPTVITVYKSPTCGCCAKWVDYLRAHAYQVVVHDTANVDPIKTKYGVPASTTSCHTALVNGYVVEGHVPVEDIQRLLRERPKNIAGLAAPGMPPSSPGMDMGNQPYTVVSFEKSGKTAVYAKH